MALRIEDPGSLPGRKVVDQEGADVGEIKDVYGLGDDGDPMWVTIVSETGGMKGDDKLVFVPLARLREDDEDLSVPYSKDHVQQAPEIEADDEISEEDEAKLRVYYSIDLADQEFRSEPRSYAAQVPEGELPSRKVTDDLESKDSGSDSDGSGDGGGDDEDEDEGKDEHEAKDEHEGKHEEKGDDEKSEREGEPEAQSS